MSKPGDKYRPSNNDEGWVFESKFCDQCKFENCETEFYCDIHTLVYFYSEDDKEYPKEWIYDKDSNPTCTKYKFWDWNDGPPPPPKYPDNPNQLLMFGFGPEQSNGDSNEPNQGENQPEKLRKNERN